MTRNASACVCVALGLKHFIDGVVQARASLFIPLAFVAEGLTAVVPHAGDNSIGKFLRSVARLPP